MFSASQNKKLQKEGTMASNELEKTWREATVA
jgi:hypothetical protein